MIREWLMRLFGKQPSPDTEAEREQREAEIRQGLHEQAARVHIMEYEASEAVRSMRQRRRSSDTIQSEVPSND